jgi:hypothetical protein
LLPNCRNKSLGRPTLLRLDGLRLTLGAIDPDADRAGKAITIDLEIELPEGRVAVPIDGHAGSSASVKKLSISESMKARRRRSAPVPISRHFKRPASMCLRNVFTSIRRAVDNSGIVT